MIRFAALTLSGLAACAMPAAQPVTPIPGKGIAQAMFAEFPDRLFDAFAAACTGAAETLRRPEPGMIRCEELPPPPVAAVLILEHGGTAEALPVLVLALDALETSSGWLVTGDAFTRVPQEAGGAVDLRVRSPQAGRDLRDLLRSLGGRPL